MKTTITIREFSGKITGTIEVDSSGDKTVRDFYGRIVGYYKAKYDYTTDFYGRIIARGDVAASCISMFGNENFK